MKRVFITLAVSIYCAVFLPLTVYGQKGPFEHRYEYKLEDVLPANKFVQKQGYWEGYRDGKLVGYVGLSKDWTKTLVVYSGKHMETLVGMDPAGTITGTKLVFHSEPIVLIGLKEESFGNFLKQYRAKSGTAVAAAEAAVTGDELGRDVVGPVHDDSPLQGTIIDTGLEPGEV